PLDDLRILELPGGLPASYCTKLLADAGADVVKVETGEHGDPLRRWSANGVTPDGDAPFFAYLNTSKRSVAVDIQASPRFLELVDWADVVVEGLGPAGSPHAASARRTCRHGARTWLSSPSRRSARTGPGRPEPRPSSHSRPGADRRAFGERRTV